MLRAPFLLFLEYQTQTLSAILRIVLPIVLWYLSAFTQPFTSSHQQPSNMSGANITGYPGVASNITFLSQCTPALCSLKDYGVMNYVPNTTANAAFAAMFLAFLFIQVVLVIIYRTWTFSVAIFCGLTLEVVGYLARRAMAHNMFMSGDFLMYVLHIPSN